MPERQPDVSPLKSNIINSSRDGVSNGSNVLPPQTQPPQTTNGTSTSTTDTQAEKNKHKQQQQQQEISSPPSKQRSAAAFGDFASSVSGVFNKVIQSAASPKTKAEEEEEKKRSHFIAGGTAMQIPTTTTTGAGGFSSSTNGVGQALNYAANTNALFNGTHIKVISLARNATTTALPNVNKPIIASTLASSSVSSSGSAPATGEFLSRLSSECTKHSGNTLLPQVHASHQHLPGHAPVHGSSSHSNNSNGSSSRLKALVVCGGDGDHGCIEGARLIQDHLGKCFDSTHNNHNAEVKVIGNTGSRDALSQQPATSENILAGMRWLSRDTRPGDDLFLYYAGQYKYNEREEEEEESSDDDDDDDENQQAALLLTNGNGAVGGETIFNALVAPLLAANKYSHNSSKEDPSTPKTTLTCMFDCYPQTSKKQQTNGSTKGTSNGVVVDLPFHHGGESSSFSSAHTTSLSPSPYFNIALARQLMSRQPRPQQQQQVTAINTTPPTTTTTTTVVPLTSTIPSNGNGSSGNGNHGIGGGNGFAKPAAYADAADF